MKMPYGMTRAHGTGVLNLPGRAPLAAPQTRTFTRLRDTCPLVSNRRARFWEARTRCLMRSGVRRVRRVGAASTARRDAAGLPGAHAAGGDPRGCAAGGGGTARAPAAGRTARRLAWGDHRRLR